MTEPVRSIGGYFRHSEAHAPRLRVGLLLDGLTTTRFVASIVADVQASNFASVELVILNGRRADAPDQAGEVDGPWLFRQYTRWDRTKQSHLSPDAPCDCSTLLQGVPTLQVTPDRRGSVDVLGPEELAEVQRYRLDVLIQLGFRELEGDLLRTARYGVWGYHYGDLDEYRGGPPLLWEVMERNPRSGVSLRVRAGSQDNGFVLRKATFPTAPGLLWSENRYGAFLGSQHFVIEELWRLHNFGWDERSPAQDTGRYRGRRPRYDVPTNIDVLRWLMPAALTQFKKSLAHRIRPTLRQWRVGLRRVDRDAAPATPREVAWLASPADISRADPVLFEKDGVTYLFIEEFTHGSKGHLSVARLDDPATLHFERCLDEPFHLSYPLVFSDGDRICMLPECVESGQVRLYEAVDFPLKWRLRSVLLDIPAVDTTPHFDGERWWLFVSTCEPRGYCPSLLLFHAESLDGPWHYHPGNPISSDIDSVRNGGPVLQMDGRTYRVSQSRSRGYGWSFTLNEIVRLTPTEYEERPAVTILPEGAPGILATHTYGRSTRWEAIDGYFAVPARS